MKKLIMKKLILCLILFPVAAIGYDIKISNEDFPEGSNITVSLLGKDGIRLATAEYPIPAARSGRQLVGVLEVEFNAFGPGDSKSLFGDPEAPGASVEHAILGTAIINSFTNELNITIRDGRFLLNKDGVWD